ncbi:MAG: DUF5134 domain-containing protein [Acidimicrobiales bacterium]
MGGTAFVSDSLAVVMLVTAAYCLGRIVAAWRWDRAMHQDINVAHVAMGIAMAGMLDVSLRTLPTVVWEAVFAALTIWFVIRIVTFISRHGPWGWDEDRMHHVSHFATHLVMGGAMLFMFLAQPAPAGAGGLGSVMGGMSTATAGGAGAALAYGFVFVLLVSAVWHADGLSRFAVAGAVAGTEDCASRRWLAPRLETGSHITMCVAMGYMLILMR